jgi:hypothetical protein
MENKMAYELETIAKEITLAVLQRTPSDDTEPEKVGKHYGKLYTTILKEIKGFYSDSATSQKPIQSLH